MTGGGRLSVAWGGSLGAAVLLGRLLREAWCWARCACWLLG
jgi:hypothetical protein